MTMVASSYTDRVDNSGGDTRKLSAISWFRQILATPALTLHFLDSRLNMRGLLRRNAQQALLLLAGRPADCLLEGGVCLPQAGAHSSPFPAPLSLKQSSGTDYLSTSPQPHFSATQQPDKPHRAPSSVSESESQHNLFAGIRRRDRENSRY
jgi:hypothetical protein